MFKSIQYQLYTYTVLLIIGVSATTLLFVTGKYTFVALGLILIIFCIYHLKKCYDRFNQNIIFIMNALDNGDYTFRFAESKLSTREKEINMTMNRIKEILVHARKEVIENETFLGLIIESVTTGIIIVNESGVVQKVNHSALNMLGLPVFSHLNQLKIINESYPQLFNRLRVGDSLQISLTTEKEEIAVSIHVSQILLKRGVMRIITLNNISDELETKEIESWNRLIRVLTHEIMNSIAPITSLSESMQFVLRDFKYLKDIKDFKELRSNSLEAFETIHTTASGLLSFVESYRKFTSFPQPKKERFDLTALVEKVVKLHERALREYNIQFRIPSAEPVIAFADESQIQQVLINLLKNAIEATETVEMRLIEISIRQETEHLFVDVANTGKPIPLDVLPHIFVPFFTTKQDGSGIGLSISRYIMRLHGGTLKHFVSPEGITVFRIVISCLKQSAGCL
ncbi:MAG: GHKL domain-containing protein [Dysgonamonadaceae bacterium]|jgi:nitrogen fixation/metabolism regulation signal transduction histidine kinase|nr:GHKL domain-containing protein [Dysgonamonadaceae bacterium]